MDELNTNGTQRLSAHSAAHASPPAPTCPSPLLDANALMSNLAGDRELAQEVVVAVVGDMPAHLDQLTDAVAAANWQLAMRTAHTQKGLMAQVGAMPLAAKLREIEQMLCAGGTIDLPAVVAVRRDYAAVEQELRNWLAHG